MRKREATITDEDYGITRGRLYCTYERGTIANGSKVIPVVVVDLRSRGRVLVPFRLFEPVGRVRLR